MLHGHEIWTQGTNVAVISGLGRGRRGRRAAVFPLGAAARVRFRGRAVIRFAMRVEPQIAFCLREAEPAGVEVRVNFGVFAGRRATPAEIDELAKALLPKVGEVAIVAEERHEIAEDSEVSLNQVRVEISSEQLPDDEHELDVMCGRLVEASRRPGRARASPSGRQRSRRASGAAAASGPPWPRRGQSEPVRAASARHARSSPRAQRRTSRGRPRSTTSGGSPLSTFRPWPATWLRMRWSRKSGTTTSCANSPGWIRSSSFHVREPPARLLELDRPHQAEAAHVANHVASARRAAASARAAARRGGPSARRGPARRAPAASRARRPSPGRSARRSSRG